VSIVCEGICITVNAFICLSGGEDGGQNARGVLTWDLECVSVAVHRERDEAVTNISESMMGGGWWSACGKVTWNVSHNPSGRWYCQKS
jgi:hypothetical protein